MADTQLPRVLQRIFGYDADQTDSIAQFGSVIAGTPLYTGDIEQIQSLNNWLNGWVGSTITDKRYPTSEETTGINKVVTQQLAYLFQSGIPEWLSSETYFKNSFCRSGDSIYISLQDFNSGYNPVIDNGSRWQLFTAATETTALENLMPYVRNGIVTSTVVADNQVIVAGSMPYLNYGLTIDDGWLSGFNDSVWLMLSSVMPEDINNAINLLFICTAPAFNQTILGYNYNNSIGIRDGYLTLILDEVEYESTLEIQANTAYYVRLEHTNDGYDLKYKLNESDSYTSILTVEINYNVWHSLPLYPGLSGNNTGTYFRGQIDADIAIYTGEDLDVLYYDMSTLLTEDVPYASFNGQLEAWCPNGRITNNNTLSNSSQTMVGNNNTILVPQTGDVYFALPDSQIYIGNTFYQTVQPDTAVANDIWYNPDTNTQQRLQLVEPNVFIHNGQFKYDDNTNYSNSWIIKLNDTSSYIEPNDYIFSDVWDVHLIIDHQIAYKSGILNSSIFSTDNVKLYEQWYTYITYGAVKWNNIAIDYPSLVSISGDGTAIVSGSSNITNTIHTQYIPTADQLAGNWSQTVCFTLGSNSFSLVGTADTTTYRLLANSSTHSFTLQAANVDGSWQIEEVSDSDAWQSNTKTYVKIDHTEGAYLVSVCEDGSSWQEVIRCESSIVSSAEEEICLGYASLDSHSITYHLSDCAFYIDGSLAWQPTKSGGYVQSEGTDNSYIATDTTIYVDGTYSTELAVANGNDWIYDSSLNYQVPTDSINTVLDIYRPNVQRVYKRQRNDSAFEVSYLGVIGYVTVEGNEGAFVASGTTVYSDSDCTIIMDTASGSNYTYTGNTVTTYTTIYGWCKTQGTTGTYVVGGLVVYEDANCTTQLEIAEDEQYTYDSQISSSLLCQLVVYTSSISGCDSVIYDFGYNGTQYYLTTTTVGGDAGGRVGETTFTASEIIINNTPVIIGPFEDANGNDGIQVIWTDSSFSFYTWNGLTEESQQWNQFVGIKFATINESLVTVDYPAVLNGEANLQLNNITNTGMSQYNPFCANTGPVDNEGNPSFLAISDNQLYTTGNFTCSTADGSIYTIADTLTLDISGYADDTYQILINPILKQIILTTNTVYIDKAFTSDMVVGDYLLNTSKLPYDCQQLTSNGIVDKLPLVWVGSVTLDGGGGLIELNTYNVNRSIIEIETGPQVVEMGSTGEIGSTSGYQWYRLYSDGFMIQGGLLLRNGSGGSATYYFLKEFVYAPVVIKNLYCNSSSGSGAAQDVEVSMVSITNSSFVTTNSSQDSPSYFQYLACGY